MRARIDRLGLGAVKFTWAKLNYKAYIGLPGNERADQLAKKRAARVPDKLVVPDGAKTRVEKNEGKGKEGPRIGNG